MDAENFVWNNWLIRWVIAPLLLACLCISDIYAATYIDGFDAKKVFTAVNGGSRLGGKCDSFTHCADIPASIDSPDWVKCDSGICGFDGNISIAIGDEVLKNAYTKWFFSKNDYRIVGYYADKIYDNKVVAEEFKKILAELIKKYGKPTKTTEEFKDLYAWLFYDTGAVGFPFSVQRFTVIWDVPKVKCEATLGVYKISIIEKYKD